MTTVHVDWDDDAQQIIRYVFQPRWNWDDFFAAVSEARALVTTPLPKGSGFSGYARRNRPR